MAHFPQYVALAYVLVSICVSVRRHGRVNVCVHDAFCEIAWLIAAICWLGIGGFFSGMFNG